MSIPSISEAGTKLTCLYAIKNTVKVKRHVHRIGEDRIFGTEHILRLIIRRTASPDGTDWSTSCYGTKVDAPALLGVCLSA